MPPPPITIFTAVRNRPGLLARTYASLLKQTCRDLEWLIVDDGSIDDVAGLVDRWRHESPFPIRCVAQRHQGKHAAHNAALTLAEGELFAALDSDDELLPQAVHRLLFHWQSIADASRARYSGITGLCVDPQGSIIGQSFPSDVLDCPHDEAVLLHGVSGEKWGCHRTAVLRQFPFPTIEGERYCPEGLIWNRIARAGYLMRHVNEPLRIYHPGGLSSDIRGVLMKSPSLARLYYRESLERRGTGRPRWTVPINYVRYSRHARVPFTTLLRDSPARPLTLACVAPGVALCALDRLRHQRSPRQVTT